MIRRTSTLTRTSRRSSGIYCLATTSSRSLRRTSLLTRRGSLSRLPLRCNSKPSSRVSLLQVSGVLQQVGGETYVRSLESAVPFGDYDLNSYLGLLRRCNVKRKFVAYGDAIRGEAMQGTPPEDLLAQAQSYLRPIAECIN